MKFLSIYRIPNRENTDGSPEMSETDEAALVKFVEESMANGTLLATGGLGPSAGGAKVRREGGKVSVTDGPFTEAKELVAGYAVLELGSKDEAVEMSKRFLAIVGDGSSEVRELFPG